MIRMKRVTISLHQQPLSLVKRTKSHTHVPSTCSQEDSMRFEPRDSCGGPPPTWWGHCSNNTGSRLPGQGSETWGPHILGGRLSIWDVATCIESEGTVMAKILKTKDEKATQRCSVGVEMRDGPFFSSLEILSVDF